MASNFIKVISDNILSPLGITSEDNFSACRSGKYPIIQHGKAHERRMRDYIENLLDKKLGDISAEYTYFEKLAIISAREAVDKIKIDVSSDDVIFLLSTTKGNVELLENHPEDPRAYLSDSANRIVSYFGNKNQPVIISNACISGVCAQIVAVRQLLGTDAFRFAVVIGCDVLSDFIVSGFESFKALSHEPCRPYDAKREGLNLGEAAATLILEKTDCVVPGDVVYVNSSIHNDANHISGPSRTGEGAFRVLTDLLDTTDRKELAFISTHGTSTLYNDEMESIALHRARLDDIPISAVKSYYGHTLGAAGVLETILAIHALKNNIVLPTANYETPGTTWPLRIFKETEEVKSGSNSFFKILSGFGGTNAGISYRIIGQNRPSPLDKNNEKYEIAGEIKVSPAEIQLNSERCPGMSLNDAYRKFFNDYPKFFKMDGLSKLGFVSAGLLLKETPLSDIQKENTAIILFNNNGSLVTDRNYQRTLSPDNYFPSPALFVYTLPNIVTGEIAIRHKIHGETSFYIANTHSETDMDDIVTNMSNTYSPSAILTGWVEYENESNYLAKIKLLIKK